MLPVPDKDITDSVDLLRWLADDHFTFLGYREYQLADVDGELQLEAVLGTGLGILRRRPDRARGSCPSMSPRRTRGCMEKRLLIITKANSRSTVHRAAYLDYIGIKIFDDDGNVIGERRFLGLFSSTAYLTSVRDLPVVQRKVAEVLARSGLRPRSHSGKDLLAILEDYPRDELFQIRTDDLFRTVMGVLRLAGRRQLRLFARKDQYGRFISCLVYLPRDRFTTANRLASRTSCCANSTASGSTTPPGSASRCWPGSTSSCGPIRPARRPRSTPRRYPAADRRRDPATGTTTSAALLERKLGDEQARLLYSTATCDALPETLQGRAHAARGGPGLAMLELLDEPGQLVMHLYRRRKNDRDVRFKVFRIGEPMMLSDGAAGAALARGHGSPTSGRTRSTAATAPIYIYDFGLVLPAGARDIVEVRPHVENAFSATWRGESEDGRLQRAGGAGRADLAPGGDPAGVRQVPSPGRHRLLAGVRWRPTLHRLPRHRRAAGRPVRDPVRHRRSRSPTTDRAQRPRSWSPRSASQLDEVACLDQDRILRSYLTLIQATLRTSFFQRAPTAGRSPTWPSSSTRRPIPDLPAPRPQYEIFVYSPRFEGVHLRFGPVARGGLRWSDRREDFRTEILGLVKAQMVKNAVIVPVGAKGGFVLKQAAAGARPGRAARPKASPATSCSSRPCSTSPTTWSAARSCRRRTWSATTATTRTWWSRRTRARPRSPTSPTRSRRATGSGWATRSPPAARPATTTRRWASPPAAPGSRSSGTSASWTWTPRPTDFTVVGIGDMSGDVFGNGMLLSEHIRLVAAFDHRHIFIDPDPDAGCRPSWNGSGCSTCPARRGTTTTASLISRRRRRLAALGQIDPDLGPRPRAAARHRRPRRDALTPAELMQRDPAGPGRPAVERRHRHLRQGLDGVARRGRRQGQRRDPGQRQRRCGPRWSARAATSASPSAGGSSTRCAAGGASTTSGKPTSAPTSSTTRPASTAPTTRSTSRSCSAARSPTAS